MSKRRTKVGDIVMIPLQTGWGVAKVLFVSKWYKDVILLGVYNLKCDSAVVPAEFPEQFAFLRYTGKDSITSGRWLFVQNQALLPAEQPLARARRIVAGGVWELDEYQRRAVDKDYNELMQMHVGSFGLVEQEVAELLGGNRRSDVEQIYAENQAKLGMLGAEEWLHRLRRSKTPALLRKAFVAILQGEYCESDECNEAVSAAEIVAAAKGAARPNLPAPAKEWAERHAALVSAELVSMAEAAMVKILTDSELRELWKEGDEGDAWELSVKDVMQRLKSGVRS